MAILINGMKGLGDNVYQRAFVKQLGKVWIDTPWPEIYEDLPNVNFVHSRTNLRTQAKNISKQHMERFSNFPGGTVKSVHYGVNNIIKGLEQSFGIAPGEFDLPDFGESPVEGEYAVIRPVTIRKEWVAETRNPLPEYIEQAANILKEKGVKIVSVADVDGVNEWIIGNEPYADIKYHSGELGIKELLSLVQHASLVVSPIGWAVPACIAAKTPAWIVCGGNGGYNHPSHITDERMDLSNIEFAIPDNMCMCTLKAHNCDKKITGHSDKFRAYLASRDWGRVSSKRGN